jgi:hypothetical protein
MRKLEICKNGDGAFKLREQCKLEGDLAPSHLTILVFFI